MTEIWTLLACALVPVASLLGDSEPHSPSSYPYNLIHDLSLRNTELINGNAHLRAQNAKLDNLHACLDARSHHKTLVEASATWAIQDLNTNVKSLTGTLQRLDQANNLLHDENFNLTQANNALTLENRQFVSSNTELAAQLQQAHANEWSLKGQVESLTLQNQQLQHDKDAFNSRSANLEDQNVNQAATIEGLHTELAALKDEHYFLQQTSNQYDSSNTQLRTSNSDLQEANTKLQDTNQKVQDLTAVLESQVPWLSAKNLELSQQNAATISENEFVEKRSNEFEATVSSLRAEVATLNTWVLRLQRASREEPFSQAYVYEGYDQRR